MVAYSDLIYEFVQDYLTTAVECSICKESDALKDDIEILETFNQRFLTLVNNIEKFDSDMEDIKALLREYNDQEFDSFVLYQKTKIINGVLKTKKENIGDNDFKDSIKSLIDSTCQYFFDEKFNEIVESKDALTMVKYLREKQVKYES